MPIVFRGHLTITTHTIIYMFWSIPNLPDLPIKPPLFFSVLTFKKLNINSRGFYTVCPSQPHPTKWNTLKDDTSVSMHLHCPFTCSSISFVGFNLHKLTSIQVNARAVWCLNASIWKLYYIFTTNIFRYILRVIKDSIQRINFSNLHQRTIWQPKRRHFSL